MATNPIAIRKSPDRFFPDEVIPESERRGQAIMIDDQPCQPRRPSWPIPDVLDFPYSSNRLHPTQKPIEALTPLVEAFTRPGDLVLDPFCGSGSTLEAAQQLGRDWIGIELSNRHYQTARRRLAHGNGAVA